MGGLYGMLWLETSALESIESATRPSFSPPPGVMAIPPGPNGQVGGLQNAGMRSAFTLCYAPIIFTMHPALPPAQSYSAALTPLSKTC